MRKEGRESPFNLNEDLVCFLLLSGFLLGALLVIIVDTSANDWGSDDVVGPVNETHKVTKLLLQFDRPRTKAEIDEHNEQRLDLL